MQIADPDLCGRYVATIIRGIQVRPSPDWLQQRLIAAGQRPINNVVDVTNFVMLEMGQPLHAFDYDRLREGRIVVRRPRPGERITLLDGSDQQLGPDHLLIADAELGLALAGVMGGADSEVAPHTTNVLLEAANFSGANTRRTASALKQRTEASLRFEKGLNPELAAQASARAMRLLLETAGGVADAGIVDAYPGRRPAARVQLTSQRLQQIAGTALPTETVRSILSGLGFPTQWKPPGTYVVDVPPWRTDIALPDDVVEEVCRIHGYDNLPSLGLSGPLPEPSVDRRLLVRESIRDALAASGCSEVITYAATSVAALDGVPAGPAGAPTGDDALALLNPMSSQYARMRTSLRPGVLACYAANARGRARAAGPCSCSKRARSSCPGPATCPASATTSCWRSAARNPPPPTTPSPAPRTSTTPRPSSTRSRRRCACPSTTRPPTRPTRAAARRQRPGRRRAGGREAAPRDAGGGRRPARPRRRRATGHRGRRVPRGVGHRRPGRHRARAAAHRHAGPLPRGRRGPGHRRRRRSAGGASPRHPHAQRLVERADLFDVYRGPQVPDGKKSLAYAVTYRSPERTLTDAEIARVRRGIVGQLQRELSASIREG